MDVLKAISKLASTGGESKRSVSARMGKRPNYLSSIQTQSECNGGGVNSNTLANVAQACGYALVLLPVDDLPPSAIVIDPPNAAQQQE